MRLDLGSGLREESQSCMLEVLGMGDTLCTWVEVEIEVGKCNRSESAACLP